LISSSTRICFLDYRQALEKMMTSSLSNKNRSPSSGPPEAQHKWDQQDAMASYPHQRIYSPLGARDVNGPDMYLQRLALDQEKESKRNAKIYSEVQETTVCDTVHARAVIIGIFAEAARTAKSRGGPEDVFPTDTWREGLASALADFDASVAKKEPVPSAVSRIRSKVSAMTLFSPDRQQCSSYGITVQATVHDIMKRQKKLVDDLRFRRTSTL
jgi:hypothetical protein